MLNMPIVSRGNGLVVGQELEPTETLLQLQAPLTGAWGIAKETWL